MPWEKNGNIDPQHATQITLARVVYDSNTDGGLGQYGKACVATFDPQVVAFRPLSSLFPPVPQTIKQRLKGSRVSSIPSRHLTVTGIIRHHPGRQTTWMLCRDLRRTI